jgi:hypothetical protein
MARLHHSDMIGSSSTLRSGQQEAAANEVWMSTPPLRVIVAYEFFAYQDAIARMLQILRPQLNVHCVEPDDLDEAMARLRPQVVFGCRRAEEVPGISPTWVLEYPDTANRVDIITAQQHRVQITLTVDDVLAILDEAEQHALAC